MPGKKIKFYNYIVNMKFWCQLGPGQYAPEKAKLDTTPKYSFGLRPDHEKPSDVPGKSTRYMNFIQKFYFGI